MHSSRGFWGFLNGERTRWWISTLAIPVVLGIAAHEFQVSENARTEKARAEAATRDAQARTEAEKRAISDKRLMLYTQLLSAREQADTEVRRGIFDKVLEKYLQPDAKNIENKIVALDLMSANFHESLDLSPLFWQLDRLVSADTDVRVRKTRLKELARIAFDVKSRQLDALALAGGRQDLELDLTQVTGVEVASQQFPLSFTDPSGNHFKRTFSVDVIEPDLQSRRVRIRVRVDLNPDTSASNLDISLWADLYDFPLVTFTRISANERIAAVLTSVQPETATASMTFIYYPSARSGVKDKPFIDEVLENLKSQP